MCMSIDMDLAAMYIGMGHELLSELRLILSFEFFSPLNFLLGLMWTNTSDTDIIIVVVVYFFQKLLKVRTKFRGNINSLCGSRNSIPFVVLIFWKGYELSSESIFIKVWRTLPYLSDSLVEKKWNDWSFRIITKRNEQDFCG
jgi:hypothetical protein